jgi:hypothetical protein
MTDERDSNEPEGAADVRAAIEQLSGGSPPSELDHEQVAARNVGDAISDQIDEQERRRDSEELAETDRQGRDTRGRFASKTEAQPQGLEPQAIEQPAQQTAAGSRVPVPPPGWTAAAKADWAKLSPAVREAVAKREQETSAGFKLYAERFKDLEPIRDMIVPRLQHLEQYGIKSAPEAINHLLTFSDALIKNPVGTIAGLVQRYGMSPEQIFGPGAGQGGPSQQQIEEQVALRVAQQTVREFEADPPPHYETVKPIMANLMATGRATAMRQAYNLAIKSLPIHPEHKIASKIRASNASLSGAPHGVSSKRTNGAAKGTFGEVTEDVRAAISQLSG